MGRIIETHDVVAIVRRMVTVNVCENKYTLTHGHRKAKLIQR